MGKMGMTAIHTAADKKDAAACLKMTLATDAGKAAVDVQDGDGCTALHYAAYASNEDAAAMLLRAGAKADIPSTAGKTAKDQATMVKANSIISLIDEGPPPEEE